MCAFVFGYLYVYILFSGTYMYINMYIHTCMHECILIHNYLHANVHMYIYLHHNANIDFPTAGDQYATG